MTGSDFRSDTVTKPSPAMRAAMAEAEVGDDVLDGDPTVGRLERRSAEASEKHSNKSNMGFGAADRIRTYTMQPFTLVKDTRTGHEETNVDAVLDGKIDGFVEAYLRWAASKKN